jgi:hypothetical protein
MSLAVAIASVGSKRSDMSLCSGGSTRSAIVAQLHEVPAHTLRDDTISREHDESPLRVLHNLDPRMSTPLKQKRGGITSV